MLRKTARSGSTVALVIAGLLDFLPNVPDMPHAACRKFGMAQQYDKAAQGEELFIQRCLVTCNLCPERPVCSEWAATLPAKQRQALGVVGGQSFVPPKSSQDGPGRPKSA